MVVMVVVVVVVVFGSGEKLVITYAKSLYTLNLSDTFCAVSTFIIVDL